MGRREAPREGHLFDFHDLPVEVARVAAASALLERASNALKESSDDGALSDVVFIVGRGTGSDQKAVLGPAIHEMLEADLQPSIEVLADPANAGRMRVPVSSLRAWAEAPPHHQQAPYRHARVLSTRPTT